MYSLLADGTDNNNTFFGEALGFGVQHNQYSLDTVREFQVNTNSYSAEFGRAGSGVINMVKSGTNDFRGGAFWYNRDRSLNAIDLINKLNGQPKSPYHFNQFGGSLGGPIQRNELSSFSATKASGARIRMVLNLPTGFTFSPDPPVMPASAPSRSCDS